MANDDAPRVDLTMEGDPIRPRPEDITAMNENFDAQVSAGVDRQMEAVNAKHATALSAATATAQGARDAALATLQAMVTGNPGDTLEAVQFRSKVQDSILAIHQGSDKPPAEHVAEAMRLNEARVQQIAATSPGASGETLGDVHADHRSGYQTFAGAYMGALFSESKRLGDSLDGES